jgi:hypothetical protein
MQARKLFVMSGLGALVIGGTPAALAAGGSSIESAPQITPGVQTFGDTNTGKLKGCAAADYWNLSLRAGDQAIVDWTSLTDSNGRDYANELSVYPSGTTDFSINNNDPAHEFSVGDNDRAESIFSANSTGSYPLIFWRGSGSCSTPGGPYNFTVTVKHSAVLFLGSVKKLAGRSGTLSVGVHAPDGQPITDGGLRVALRGSWPGHKASELASGTPTNGAAKLSVKLPKSARGKKVSIRAVAQGADYLPARSSVRTVRVGRH